MICQVLPLDARALSVPSEWDGPLKAFEEHLRVGGARDETLHTRVGIARRIARGLQVPPAQVTPVMLESWLASHDWMPATRKSYRSTARALWSYFLQTGVTSLDAAAGMPVIHVPRYRPQPLPETVYHEALAAADDRRVRILRLADEYGLRRAEIAVVNEADLIDDLDGVSLIVHGKGGRDRMIPLMPDMAALLKTACKAGGGWAFPGRTNGHLSPSRVGHLAKDVLGDRHLHQGRHRAATLMLRKTKNIRVVQEFLGHQSLASTQIYTEVSWDELRAAVEAVAAA